MLQTAEFANRRRPTVFLVGHDQSSQARIARFMHSHAFLISIHATAESMLEAAEEVTSGCVIFEVELPRMSALQAQAILAERSPALATLFLSDDGTVSSCARALKAGAQDFLEKSCSDIELRSAIADALRFNSQRRQELAEEAEAIELVSRLTKRELEVFQLVARGFTNPEVARLLSMAVETAKAHRARVMRKLEATSVPDLVILAQAVGLS